MSALRTGHGPRPPEHGPHGTPLARRELGLGAAARALLRTPTPSLRDEGPSPAPWPCLGLVTNPEPPGRLSADPHAPSPERSRHSFEVL